ncbi:MAG: hypothetical protein EB060_00320 [Proteobacteria bacterium]|nr:hypothetical protein [Pseudomonadota bacterium]
MIQDTTEHVSEAAAESSESVKKESHFDAWMSNAEQSRGRYLWRRSGIVNKFKYLIGITALMLVAVLIIWPFTAPEERRIQMAISDAKDKGEENEKPKMMRPRFHGVDKNDQPFTIIAESATQLDPENLLLDTPSGDVMMKDGSWISLNSKSATYKMKEKKVLLAGGVNVFLNNGYEMHTDAVAADMESGEALSQSTVKIQGDAGTLDATGFRAEERGNVIYFTGPVKVTIYMSK